MPTENDDDIVTEASMESFPASDPPGWIRSSAATCDPSPPATQAVDISDLPSELRASSSSDADMRPSSTSGPELRRLKRLLLASGIALVAGAIATFFVVRSRRRAAA